MPKKVLKIDKFDGGLNNNSLPRDIDPDEIADINNLMVDERGQVRTMGTFSSFIADSVISNFDTLSGYNLHTYSTDFDESGNVEPFPVIVVASPTISEGMQIIDQSDNTQAFTGVMRLKTSSNNAGSGTNAKIIFHNVDGRLYATDTVFTNTNAPTIREYIKASYHKYTEATNGQRDITAWTDYSNSLSAPSQNAEVKFEANPTVNSSTQHAIVRLDADHTGTWDITSTNFKLYYSYVLRDGSETKLKEYSYSSFTTDSNRQLAFKIWLLHQSNHGVLDTDISNQYKGMRIYWNQTDNIYSNSHHLVVDIDFEKGYKVGTSSYYSQDFEEPVDDATISASTFDSLIDIGPFTNPSDLAHVTYEILNGVSPNNLATGIRYKTSCVANRRVYLGNVEYNDGNTTRLYSDRMLKSRVNKFSQFSTTDFVDVTVNDGDDITALQEYADRILQFKNKKMHLINISKEFEFLEDTFIGKGCAGPYAVTKTDFGVAWVNENGCFLYDGRNVINLLEERNGKLIKDSTWQAFVNSTTTVGYSPKNRVIIVMDSTSTTDDMYLYHIPTRSWTKGDSGTSHVSTNFAIDKDQELIVLDKGASNTTSALIRKWDTTSQNQTITLNTKDFDFGNPATKKHVRKVSLSYKCASGNTPDVFFDVNGGSSLDKVLLTSNLVDNGNFDSNTTGWNADGTATLSVNGSNQLVITSGGSSNAKAVYTMTTESGVTYNVSGNFVKGTADQGLVQVGTSGSLGSGVLGSQSAMTSDTKFSFTFTATGTTTFLILYEGSGVQDNGDTTIWDNIIVYPKLSNQSDFTTLELKPNTSSEARNINSFQVKLTGSTDSNFILSDISIIYREKSPR